ncbi:Dps family protein [Qingshengfaniella alkalisoli]|uniref:DNA starvation/stationary phase protection protein n=1 Tax=Qingshengfaniella alkalisoli TaxID=2599296 RepID=A0A5B8J6M5_9RHOB|nr:DNA starvation/stationary phase protection protein [Qingshengfaniella alkalisoli]QDY70087.1 DNA starvation/stationary phase protection protein [Qingshengfaniella alkalisoli]
MAEKLAVVPQPQEVKTGVRDPEIVAQALSKALADTYRLVFKTHAFHWNVEGPLFYGVHNLTEEQYENLFQAADDMAERIRALGALAPMTLRQIIADSVIEDADKPLNAREMVESLAKDHERAAHRLHALIELAEGRNDMVTGDLATERSAFHEKAAWMLRAIAA